MKKLFLFDLETTGLDHVKNGIHQLSGKIVIDGQTKEAFNFKVKPHADAIIDDGAIAISGVTRRDLAGYEDMSVTYRKLHTILSRYIDKFNRGDKFFLVGFNNASFDNQFLRQWFLLNGDKYFGSFFWSNSIDVMVLAAQYLIDHRHTMLDFKLRTVASALGIVIDESRLHDAEYDIDLTHLIYQMVTNSQTRVVRVSRSELDDLVSKIWEPVLEMSEEDDRRSEEAAKAIQRQADLYKNFYQLEQAMQLS